MITKSKKLNRIGYLLCGISLVMTTAGNVLGGAFKEVLPRAAVFLPLIGMYLFYKANKLKEEHYQIGPTSSGRTKTYLEQNPISEEE